MKKRKVLLAALLVCFSMSYQTAKGEQKSHIVDEDIKGGTYEGYQNSNGGVLQTNQGHTSEVKGAAFNDNTATGDGGVIYNSGSITVYGSSFNENSASSYHEGNGGAIYNLGDITIDNSSFTKNKAGDGEYWQEDSHGGAVYNNNKVTITNSTFTGNRAKYGGAIYNDKDAGLTVQGTFKDNTAQTGGVINNHQGTVTVGQGSVFENNSATRFDGGAITNDDGTVNIGNNVTFKNNNACNTEEESGSQNGGAIFSQGYGNSQIQIGNNVTFEGNKAEYGGGIGLYVQNDVTIEDNATFKNNQAGQSGGAIYVFTLDDDAKASNFTIGNNAVFEGNQAGFDDVEGYTPGFVSGGAISVNQQSYNSDKNNSFTIGDNAIFRNNKAFFDSPTVYGYGGAIYNAAYNTTVGKNALFEGNISDYGGAVYNQGNLTINQNATFKNNNASLYGGAIYNTNSLTLGENAVFDGNSASSMGGAIFNWTTQKIHIQKAVFRNNESAYGGAIYAYSGDLDINESAFYGNKATNSGGALVTQETTSIENSIFENNTSENRGGAIYNVTQESISKTSNLTINNSRFTNNKALYGGAIAAAGANTTTKVTNSYFNNNSTVAGGQGGAIWSDKSAEALDIEGSIFENNTADDKGGAIAAYKSATITDTSFVNNKAGNKGGAIWANDDITVNASESDVVFAGNSANDGADIYMDNSSSSKGIGKLTLTSAKDKNITLADGISGAEAYSVNLNGEGTVTFNGEIKNANMEVTNGTLHLAQGSSIGEGTTVNVKGATLDSQDGRINDYSGGKVNIGDGAKLKFDLSSANKTTDKFTMGEGLKSSGTVTVEDFNFLADTKVSSGSMTSDEIRDSLGLGEEVKLDLPEKSLKALTPLRYVNVQSGQNGISYSPTGNSYRDFNPAVMAAPVAAQLGGYLTQLDSYDEAFRNMDMYMIMPKSVRQSMKFRNKYASAENDLNIGYDNSVTPYDSSAVWARPYATFENVGLKRGPRVSNVAWGTYFGGDSKLYELGNGWEGMWGVYAGYNGSHQVYNGISIYQNGGTLGVTGTLYKNNFFTGLTANVGANAAEASTNYGDDSFALLRTGVASKTGYNVEFADGKFIIQPSWLMSYSFINTGDYTTSSGIRVNSDPLNAIHIEPGLKFIGNGRKGWQPYAGLSIVWNFLDKTDFTASDATLPELSVKPFFKYGLGLRKLYGERFVGYGQIYFANGGRNGVGFQFGGRWSL